MHLCFPLTGPASGAHGSLVGQQYWHLGHGAQGIISGRPWGYIDSLRLGLCLVADPANGGGSGRLWKTGYYRLHAKGSPPTLGPRWLLPSIPTPSPKQDNVLKSLFCPGGSS